MPWAGCGVLVDSYQRRKEYEVNFNDENYPSNVFLQVKSSTFVDTKKMVY
jgi:hypothetical protein